MRKLLSPVLVALALLSTGCFDLLQEVWIGADGSGRFKVVYTFDQDGIDMIAKMPARNGKDPLEAIVQDVKTAHEELRKDPLVRNVSISKTIAPGKQELTVEIEVTDATQLMKYAKKALQPKDMPDRSRSPTQSEFTIERLDGGNFLFLQKRSAKAKVDDRMSEMAEKIYKDHAAVIRVHGPSIVANNGTVAADGAVEWKVKLARPQDAPEEMRAEVAVTNPLLRYAPLAGAGLVLLLAIGFALRRPARGGNELSMRRTRPEPKATDEPPASS